MKRRSRWVVGVVLLAGFVLFARWSNEAMTTGPNRDSTPETLAKCPDSPNCVCTFDSDDEHGIESIALSGEGTPEEKLERVLAAAEAIGGKLVTRKPRYLHLTYTTPILRFIDDVEFLVDESGEVLHFRSASRVGHSDLGVNRRRMERFRKRFLAK